MEKYDTFQSLVLELQQAFVVFHFVRLTLATAPMTRLSDRWSDDRDHVGTVVPPAGRIPDLG